MKLDITKKEKNALIGRTEVEATLTYQGVTPSNRDVTASIAKQLSCEEKLVVVKQIKGVFSEQKAIVTAVAYDSQVALDKYEMSTKHLRKVAEEKAKKEAEEQKTALEAKKKAEEEAAAAKEAEKAEPAQEETKETGADEKKEEASVQSGE